MFENREPNLGLIAYLSLSKLEQLHGNLEPLSGGTATETTETKVTGDLSAKVSGLLGFLSGQASGGGERRMVKVREGAQNPYSKLLDTVKSYSEKNAIADLRECMEGQKASEETALYALSATFSVDINNADSGYVKSEQEKEDAVPVVYADARAESGMCILRTDVGSYELLLACSLKFFADMGSSRSFGQNGEEDIFRISPHSGNHFFFSGKVPCRFDALFFLSHQQGNTLFGSPLVLYQSFQPSFSNNLTSA